MAAVTAPRLQMKRRLRARAPEGDGLPIGPALGLTKRPPATIKAPPAPRDPAPVAALTDGPPVAPADGHPGRVYPTPSRNGPRGGEGRPLGARRACAFTPCASGRRPVGVARLPIARFEVAPPGAASPSARKAWPPASCAETLTRKGRRAPVESYRSMRTPRPTPARGPTAGAASLLPLRATHYWNNYGRSTWSFARCLSFFFLSKATHGPSTSRTRLGLGGRAFGTARTLRCRTTWTYGWHGSTSGCFRRRSGGRTTHSWPNGLQRRRCTSPTGPLCTYVFARRPSCTTGRLTFLRKGCTTRSSRCLSRC